MEQRCHVSVSMLHIAECMRMEEDSCTKLLRSIPSLACIVHVSQAWGFAGVVGCLNMNQEKEKIEYV